MLDNMPRAKACSRPFGDADVEKIVVEIVVVLPPLAQSHSLPSPERSSSGVAGYSSTAPKKLIDNNAFTNNLISSRDHVVVDVRIRERTGRFHYL